MQKKVSESFVSMKKRCTFALAIQRNGIQCRLNRWQNFMNK